MMTEDKNTSALILPRATRALSALRGTLDDDGESFVQRRQGRYNESSTASRMKLAELELLRATCECVGAPPNSGYDDLLVDKDGRVYDDRTGDPIYDRDIIEWVKTLDDDAPCYGDHVDHAFARRFE